VNLDDHTRITRIILKIFWQEKISEEDSEKPKLTFLS
jgi:hypothetical protein